MTWPMIGMYCDEQKQDQVLTRPKKDKHRKHNRKQIRNHRDRRGSKIKQGTKEERGNSQ